MQNLESEPAGEIPVENSSSPSLDMELDARVALLALAGTDPLNRFAVLRELGNQRSARDPAGSVRAFGRAWQAAGKIMTSKERTSARKSIMGQASKLPPEFEQVLRDACLATVREIARANNRGQSRSAVTMANALYWCEPTCVSLFRLASEEAREKTKGMARRNALVWSLCAIARMFSPDDQEYALVFLLRAESLSPKCQDCATVVAEIISASSCLTPERRSLVLSSILKTATYYPSFLDPDARSRIVALLDEAYAASNASELRRTFMDNDLELWLARGAGCNRRPNFLGCIAMDLFNDE